MKDNSKEQIPEVILRDEEVNGLREALQPIPDSRRKKHSPYEFTILLTVMIYATLCGYVGASGAARYIKTHDAYFMKLFNLNTIPTAPAFQKVIDRVDQLAVKEVVASWAEACSPDITERYSKIGEILASRKAKRKPVRRLIHSVRFFGMKVVNNITAVISYDLIKNRYGPDMDLGYIKEIENVILIDLESTTKTATCPYCGEKSHSHRQKVDRFIWDEPIDKKLVLLHVTFYRYNCMNPKCTCHTFREELPFAIPKARRTVAVDARLLEEAIGMSFRSVASAASRLAVNVSASTVGRLIRNIEIIYNKQTDKIGVDDVAKRRGITYYTVIYDYDTHLPIALLDGRDGTELEEWLKEGPSISVIMRDRSGNYSDAIVRVYGGRIQEVADRFHLMQNINKHLQDELYKAIKETHFYAELEDDKKKSVTKVARPLYLAQPENDDPWATIFDNPAQILTDDTDDTSGPKWHLADKQHPVFTIPALPQDFPHLNYTDAPPCNTDGSPIEYDYSLRTKQEKEKAAQKRAVRQMRKPVEIHEDEEAEMQRLKDKQELAITIRSAYATESEKKGKRVSADDIANLLNLDKYVVRKYLKMTDQEVRDITVLKSAAPKQKPEPKPTIWKAPDNTILNIIYKMQKDGWDDWITFQYVFHHPKFRGTPSTLEHYINCIGSNNFPGHINFCLSRYVKASLPPNVVHFTRTAISRYILTVNPNTKKDKVIDSVMDELKIRYPIISRIQLCVREFHDILEGYDVEPLLTWIATYDDLIHGFCQGLFKDIEAVKNAIKTDYSSGFVEGNNNGLKLVKRIGSGKYSTKGLLNKLTLSLARKLNTVDCYEIVRTRKFIVHDISTEKVKS